MVALSGVFSALVTPFTKEGEVDKEAFEMLLDRQIANNVSLVPVGTTGESPTLTKEEKKYLISTCVEKAKGKDNIFVVAGAGSNNTKEAIEMTKWCQSAGVDATLQVIPYYNKPSQEGLYAHFEAIVKAVPGCPIVLYNIPGRCGIKLTPETVAKLYNDFEEVIAIKESTGSLDIATEIASLCDITILSGDDSLTLPLMSVGGKGVISVLSNWAPEIVNGIYEAAASGDYATAAKRHQKAFKLFKTMFCEPNPEPVKCAMSMLGQIEDSLRLPMVSVDDDTRKKIAEVMKEYGYKVNPNKRGRA